MAIVLVLTSSVALGLAREEARLDQLAPRWCCQFRRLLTGQQVFERIQNLTTVRLIDPCRAEKQALAWP
jgi:hypothetical protein